ncbi:hypothetical protein LAZ29_01150 [Cereibacter sphaeroides]|nr:hypothetical protein [Cereibacter sphaeroides]MCE6949550.1 hypothetical protein [Cereibacter sphaeroides]
MQISDRRTGLRMGRETRIGAEAVGDIGGCIAALNRRMWAQIRAAGYPA